MTGEALEPTIHNPNPVIEYSEDTKKEAVRQAIEEGKSIRALALELGVDRDVLSGWIREIGQEEGIEEQALNINLIKLLGGKTKEIVAAMSKTKLDKASLRDSAVALGILLDKRRDLLGPSAGPASLNLKVAWRDGSGAVELSTGQPGK